MKKVLFGIVGLGTVIGLVAVMSCGGSSSGGAATGESAAAASIVSSVLVSGGGIPGIGSLNVNSTNNPTCDGSTITIPATPITCGTGTGDVSVAGTYSCSTSGSASFNITETFENNCTWDVSTCSMGNTVITGTVTIAFSGNYADAQSNNFSFTIKSDALNLAWGASKTKSCAIDLTFNDSSSIDWSSDTSVANAMTGTICGADWTETVTSLNDPAKLEALCTALNAETASL